QVRKCYRPMLFIHGEQDDYVPTEMVYRLYEAKPQPKALWIAPGSPHAWSYHDHPAEYTRQVRQFLSRYLDNFQVRETSLMD
ncbi:MAG: alpha/beta hydrolase, partial [Bacteroidaceae bacterium]|nr:alpha/beta hydrolase [Bacteroidaceae bacterium]